MQLQQAGARLAAIQRAIDLMARDLRQSGHRGVRDAYGRPLAPIAGAPRHVYATASTAPDARGHLGGQLPVDGGAHVITSGSGSGTP